jgi:negative regulator of flagellin synthesis FlgM
MRIDAYNKISQVYQTNTIQKTNKATSIKSTDQVEISRTAKDYQIAKQAVAATADIREDKIKDIKSRLESGTYNISMEEVSNAVVEKYFEKTI